MGWASQQHKVDGENVMCPRLSQKKRTLCWKIKQKKFLKVESMSRSQINYRFKVYFLKEFHQRHNEREQGVGSGIKYNEIKWYMMTQRISIPILLCVHF